MKRFLLLLFVVMIPIVALTQGEAVVPSVVTYSPTESNSDWTDNPGPTTASAVNTNSKAVNIRGVNNISEGNVANVHASADAEL